MKTVIAKLKSEIKRLAAEQVQSRSERNKYKIDHHEERESATYSYWFYKKWCEKGDRRSRIRGLLLAYAFLRGRTYASQESPEKSTGMHSALYYGLMIAGVEIPGIELYKGRTYTSVVRYPSAFDDWFAGKPVDRSGYTPLDAVTEAA